MLFDRRPGAYHALFRLPGRWPSRVSRGRRRPRGAGGPIPPSAASPGPCSRRPRGSGMRVGIARGPPRARAGWCPAPSPAGRAPGAPSRGSSGTARVRRRWRRRRPPPPAPRPATTRRRWAPTVRLGPPAASSTNVTVKSCGTQAPRMDRLRAAAANVVFPKSGTATGGDGRPGWYRIRAAAPGTRHRTRHRTPAVGWAATGRTERAHPLPRADLVILRLQDSDHANSRASAGFHSVLAPRATPASTGVRGSVVCRMRGRGRPRPVAGDPGWCPASRSRCRREAPRLVPRRRFRARPRRRGGGTSPATIHRFPVRLTRGFERGGGPCSSPRSPTFTSERTARRARSASTTTPT